MGGKPITDILARGSNPGCSCHEATLPTTKSQFIVTVRELYELVCTKNDIISAPRAQSAKNNEMTALAHGSYAHWSGMSRAGGPFAPAHAVHTRRLIRFKPPWHPLL